MFIKAVKRSCTIGLMGDHRVKSIIIFIFIIISVGLKDGGTGGSVGLTLFVDFSSTASLAFSVRVHLQGPVMGMVRGRLSRGIVSERNENHT
jgi:hypothetical protein